MNCFCNKCLNLNKKKYVIASTKILRFYIDNMFLEHQISKMEWFLKDHVTLKTGVMAAEYSVLPSQNDILKSIIIENSYFKL